MMKQIKVHGQRVELYSLDEGRTWSSNPQSIVAYGHRKELLRLELQDTFARIDEMRDLDPDNFSEVDTPKSLTKANENIKGTAPWTRYRLLDLILGAALDAPAAWIATETKLALLTTEAFIGRAIHVDTVLGRITLHGKARSAQEKANDTSEIKKMRER